MKKFINVIIILFVLMLSSFSLTQAQNYTPITETNAGAAVGEALNVFADFPNFDYDVLVADNPTPGLWNSLNLTAPTTVATVTNIAWPKESSMIDAINDGNVPLYFIFNSERINREPNPMDDDALVGLILKNLGKLYDIKVGFGTPADYANWQAVTFGDQMIVEKILMKVDATIPIYKYLTWADTNFPPVTVIGYGDVYGQSGPRPAQVRQDFLDTVMWATFQYNSTPAELLSAAEFAVYQYFINN